MSEVVQVKFQADRAGEEEGQRKMFVAVLILARMLRHLDERIRLQNTEPVHVTAVKHERLGPKFVCGGSKRVTQS
eukprot:6439097-Amphidinium_carterae.1